MKIAIGADHAGFSLKERLRLKLAGDGHQIVDFGTESEKSCDYPDFAQFVARDVAQGRSDRGILVCSTGIGMAMAANKVTGVRAAVVTDVFTARATRAHNDANVMTVGERVIGTGVAEEALRVFRDTAFEGGRHALRVAKVDALDRAR